MYCGLLEKGLWDFKYDAETKHRHEETLHDATEYDWFDD